MNVYGRLEDEPIPTWTGNQDNSGGGEVREEFETRQSARLPLFKNPNLEHFSGTCVCSSSFCARIDQSRAGSGFLYWMGHAPRRRNLHRLFWNEWSPLLFPTVSS